MTVADREPFTSSLARARRAPRSAGAPEHGRVELSTAIRWGVLSLVLLGALLGGGSRRTLAAAAVLVANAIFRTISPIGGDARARGVRLAFGLEAALCLGAVAVAGSWSTLFVLTLGAAVLTAGLDGGLGSVLAAIASILAGCGTWLAWTQDTGALPEMLESVTVFALVGAIGAYGGHIEREALRRASALARLESATAERGRVARELHDRLGQSLAAIGLALDRLAGDSARDGATAGELGSELARLADDVRYVSRQMREQLAELRSDPGEHVDLAGAISGLLARVELRSAVRTALLGDSPARLPPLVEHEVWKIAQEAVINAERHARASAIVVRWECDGRGARLEVADDGCGLADRARRPDAFGIIGMRERASVIGAALDIRSAANTGTTVALELHGVRP